MRASGETVLTSGDCMAKIGALYFTDEERNTPCGGNLHYLPKMWVQSANGNLDAVVCGRHAKMFLNRESRGYLAERLNAIGVSR